MNDTKTQLDSIQEAYMGVITEGKEAKFKVGDKVGVGNNSDWSKYHPYDTGTVSKVDKRGQHTVEYDNIKSMDNPETSHTGQFDHTGVSKIQHSGLKIIPLEQHENHIKDTNNRNTRAKDLSSIAELINGKRNGFGDYSKLSKEHATHIKSLLDKHTEE
jgi:hypothetical protein